MLEKIKQRLGISPNVKIYDSELFDLIEHAKFDMMESGVPQKMIDDETPAVINTTVFFIRTVFLVDDIKTAERYEKLYEKSVFRLSLMGGE